jgi:hypothetical protein
MDSSKIRALFAKGPSDEEGSGSDDPRLSAAEDIIKAIKDGDAEALDVALADHYRECQAAEAPDDESEE